MRKACGRGRLTAIVVAVTAVLVQSGCGAKADPDAVRYSARNIHTIVSMMLQRAVTRTNGAWPPYDGKNFVLSVVATRQLTARNASVLFSPGDKRRGPETVDPRRYEEVTKAALKRGADFSDLTSYAGRRNGSGSSYRITPDQLKRGTPLIADLTFPDIAIVGFSDGSVRTLSREELGLGSEDPIVAGDASASELLRALSEE